MLKTQIKDILGKTWDIHFYPTKVGVDIYIQDYTDVYPLDLFKDTSFIAKLESFFRKNYPNSFYTLVKKKSLIVELL